MQALVHEPCGKCVRMAECSSHSLSSSNLSSSSTDIDEGLPEMTPFLHVQWLFCCTAVCGFTQYEHNRQKLENNRQEL